MTRRREFLFAFAAAALSTPLASFAQPPPAKNLRIGLLGAESASGFASRVEALHAGLRELGYVEGRNVLTEYRFAEGKYDRLPVLAADLVRSKADVIVTSGTPATRAAKDATSSIPIVMASSGDAVATGLVASLARPGGNLTGSAFLSPELTAKRLEMLKEALPRISRVGYVSNPGNPVVRANLKAMEVTGGSLKVGVRRFDARGAGDVDGIFAAMAEARVDAVVIGQDSLFTTNHRAIADLAAKHRLPAIGAREFAEAGGLFGYGHDNLVLWRRAAIYIDKIVRGAKPADLPIQQPTNFELVVNMKTARALGISVPNSIAQRADKVIE